MKALMKTGFVWMGMLLSFSAWGQFTPLGALPMEYNGSFAGEAGAPRVSLNSQYGRSSWGDYFKSQYFRTDVSYDQFIPGIRSGIGITAAVGDQRSEHKHANHMNSITNYSSFNLSVAPKLSIKGKYTLSPSVSISYRKLEMERDGQAAYSSQGFGSNVGLLFNTSKYYIGYAIAGPSNVQPRDWRSPHWFFSTLQAGYTFQKSPESNFSFTPQLVIRIAGYYGEVDNFRSFLRNYVPAYNLSFRYKTYIWGVNNAGIHLGLQTDRLRLMMTHDPGYFNFYRGGTSSSDDKNYLGSLSLRYIFNEKGTKHRF